MEGINAFLYGRLLLLLLPAAGLYFTFRTRGVQLRLFPEACRLAGERPETEGGLSPFGALMVSTASRVGTGNIVGVSSAICLGGSGALFWLFLTSLIGAASGFVECTLAQIYKRRGPSGQCHGGPAYYIEAATGRRWLAVLFCLLLIATHGVGFNMLSSYNLQSAFSGYRFYDPARTPWLIGLALALLCLYCLCGGGRRISAVSEFLVPLMGLLYTAVAAIILLRNLTRLPQVLGEVFRSAFDAKAIFAGLSGSCLMLGMRRGLFSSEAGMGSSPNAAAAVETSHPIKQGLAQMLSVFIDTLLCLATGVICLCSDTAPSPELAGMPYVLRAVTQAFGPAGQVFITAAMVLFAFTTLVGNFFYIDNCFLCLFSREPSDTVKRLLRVAGCAVTFAGCGMSMEAVWSTADLLMGLMCLINVPVLWKLCGVACRCLADYQAQRRAGHDPRFRARDIGLEGTEYWR